MPGLVHARCSWRAAVALAACEVNLNSEGIVSRETKTFKVAGMPDVQLETFDGSIEVHSWDRNEVEVEIEKRAMEQAMVDEMGSPPNSRATSIIVKVTNRGRDFDGVQIGVNFSPTARLRVAVPRNSQLTAASGDGSITVEDVNGKIALTTNDGSVRASRVTGELSRAVRRRVHSPGRASRASSISKPRMAASASKPGRPLCGRGRLTAAFDSTSTPTAR